MLSRRKFTYEEIKNNLSLFKTNSIHFKKRLSILKELHEACEETDDYSYHLVLFGTMEDLANLDINISIKSSFGDIIISRLVNIESIGLVDTDQGFFLKVNEMIVQKTPIIRRCDCGDTFNLIEYMHYAENELNEGFDSHTRVCVILHEEVKELKWFKHNLEPTLAK